MLATYLIALTVFLGIVITLVVALLLVEAKVVLKGVHNILINDNPDKNIQAPSGWTLLAALSENNILLPSACGGKGSCGFCKCTVEEGGQEILPTELPHLSRTEKLNKIRLSCQLKVKDDLQIRIPEEIFNIVRYRASVVSNDNVASFIKELRLKLDPGQTLDFKTGSYVQIDIPPYERSYREIQVAERFKSAWDHCDFWKHTAYNDEPVHRAYSLANTPAEEDLRFTIRIATPPPGSSDIPPGIASSYLFTLKPDDPVTLCGPYGDFFIQESEREMCFIGGGAGMAPLRSHIIHQLLTVGSRRKMSFWYGARSRIEMFYDEEFQRLQTQFKNFTYHVALSDPQPEDHWEGFTGFIHQVTLDQYLRDHPDPAEIEYYLCGPPMMNKAVLEMLDNLGVDPEMIKFDDFGG